MSDILTRLAVLAAKDENGLFPCPKCGQIKTLKYEQRQLGNMAIACNYYGDGCGLELLKFNKMLVAPSEGAIMAAP